MHRLVAPRDQKYQSNFVEVRAVCSNISTVICRTRADEGVGSSGTTRSCTAATRDCSSAYVLTRTTTSSHTWRPSTSSLRFSVCPSSSTVRLHRRSEADRDSVCADSFFDNVCELDLVFNFYKVLHCCNPIPFWSD